MCVKADESPQVFIPCVFCRPGTNVRGKTRESSKKWQPPLFRHKNAPHPFLGKEPSLFSLLLIRFFGKLKLIFRLERRTEHISRPHIVARGVHLVYRVRYKLAINLFSVQLVYLICVINIAGL